MKEYASMSGANAHQNDGRDTIGQTLPGCILKLRACRNELFGRSVFGEPAWDILLHLYDARLRARAEYITEVAAASGVPFTTALRWLACLEDRDWIEREIDLSDHRRSLISLSPKAVETMERFFNQPEFTKSLGGLG